MTDRNLDLQIMLGIVNYLTNRRIDTDEDSLTLSDILGQLPQGTSIQTIIGAVIQPEGIIMGDKYETGQGVVGPGAMAVGNTFSQLWIQQGGEIDLPQLSTELQELRQKAKATSSGEVEQDLAIGALASAEKAAAAGDGPKALDYLRQAGQWILDLAKSIGVPVATKALQAAMGLPG